MYSLYVMYHKTISKGGGFINSPFLENCLCGKSRYLRYNQFKHCGSVTIELQQNCFAVIQINRFSEYNVLFSP